MNVLVQKRRIHHEVVGINTLLSRALPVEQFWYQPQAVVGIGQILRRRVGRKSGHRRPAAPSGSATSAIRVSTTNIQGRASVKDASVVVT